MARSRTTWLALPMKTSDLFIGGWDKMWDIANDEKDRVSILLTIMTSRSRLIGYGGCYHVRYNGEIVAVNSALSGIIQQLEKGGYLKDDLGLTDDYRFGDTE